MIIPSIRLVVVLIAILLFGCTPETKAIYDGTETAAVEKKINKTASSAACNFIQLNSHSPIGQSLQRLIADRGPSGYSRLPGEDGWSFDSDEFQKMNIIAPNADSIWFGTYKSIIFQSNLRYSTKILNSIRTDLAISLNLCAKRLTQACWIDNLGSFYQIASDSKDTYLYITSPHYGAPNDPDIPPKDCVDSSQQGFRTRIE